MTSTVFACKYCSYTSKRKHDIRRHQGTKHKSENVVISFLEDLVDDILMRVTGHGMEHSDDTVQDSFVEVGEGLNNSEAISSEDSDSEADIRRHQRTKHNSENLVIVLLNDFVDEILVNVNGDDKEHSENSLQDSLLLVGEGSEAISSEDSDSTSDILSRRDKHVADLWAEFRRQFPTFQDELRALKVVKRRKKRRASTVVQGPLRCSTRIRNRLETESSLISVSEQNLSSNDDKSLNPAFDTTPSDRGYISDIYSSLVQSSSHVSVNSLVSDVSVPSLVTYSVNDSENHPVSTSNLVLTSYNELLPNSDTVKECGDSSVSFLEPFSVSSFGSEVGQDESVNHVEEVEESGQSLEGSVSESSESISMPYPESDQASTAEPESENVFQDVYGDGKFRCLECDVSFE